PAEEVAEILTDIGLEVEGMEAWESIEGGLEGVVVGEVLECERHPNADKLSLTKVDIGAEQPLQIVCGAPNVAAGQKVLVAQVGTTLHFHNGEALTLKKTKIRGEVSEGMICAEDELGLGTDHSGILVLPADTPVGIPASEVFPIERDTVFEIGLTPNRSDATCHRGVAQDLAAALKIHHGHSGQLRCPDTQAFRVESRELPVEVIVENTEACPRYSGVSIAGVQVKESPDWLKNRLRAIGQRPINNIVDITNFILHDMGQPLHAFDLDKIADRTVRVKTLPEGTPFTTLDEVERRLSAEDLMICDGSSRGMCIAGVFGGVGSGVTEATTNIFLESAHFNPRWIRRTSTRFNLRTDAARVFEKGSDPNLTVEALKRAAALMVELGGGRIASDIVDVYPEPVKPVRVQVAWEYVNRLIGVPMRREEVLAILDALNMAVVEQSEAHFVCEVPTNKADVTRPADVVEEILRIYGLNRVPIPSLIRSTPTPA
ncbi:MAG: phenylalanine--tRNA ligase subunit beta, partial [Bacteroidetes bacterium]